MTKVLWAGTNKADAEANLKKVYLPADPNAYIEQRGDEWVIYANAQMEPVPTKIVKA